MTSACLQKGKVPGPRAQVPPKNTVHSPKLSRQQQQQQHNRHNDHLSISSATTRLKRRQRRTTRNVPGLRTVLLALESIHLRLIVQIHPLLQKRIQLQIIRQIINALPNRDSKIRITTTESPPTVWLPISLLELSEMCHDVSRKRILHTLCC